MAKKTASSIDRSVDRIGYWHGAWGILRDNFPALAAYIIAFGGGLIAAADKAWQHMQDLAMSVGWFMYVYVGLLVFFAFIGAGVVVLLISRWFRGLSAIGEKRDLSGQLLKAISGNEWAKDLIELSIQDAACAFACVTPESYDLSPRAKQIAGELRSLASRGWLASVEDWDATLGQATLWAADSPSYSKKENVSNETMIPKPHLRDANGRGYNVEWLG